MKPLSEDRILHLLGNALCNFRPVHLLLSEEPDVAFSVYDLDLFGTGL
jgi:hypothetical protein